jgi:hypothetical protein
MLSAIAYAGELNVPPPLKDLSVSQQRFYRDIYNNWNNIEVTTTNPNGSRRGEYGDIVFYNNSGTYKLCVQTTSGGGTTWVCSSAYSTP